MVGLQKYLTVHQVTPMLMLADDKLLRKKVYDLLDRFQASLLLCFTLLPNSSQCLHRSQILFLFARTTVNLTIVRFIFLFVSRQQFAYFFKLTNWSSIVGYWSVLKKWHWLSDTESALISSQFDRGDPTCARRVFSEIGWIRIRSSSTVHRPNVHHGIVPHRQVSPIILVISKSFEF